MLFIADDDGFRIVANDLELGIETGAIDAEIIEKGSVALNAKTIMDIIRNLPGETVSIESDSQDITMIKSGTSEFRIYGFPGDEFVMLPNVEKHSEYALNAHIFKNMIRQTIFAVSTDEYKATLMGEQFKVENGKLKLAAIDGFRLALKETAIENADDRAEEIIIPAKSLNEIFKILPSDKDSVIYVYVTTKHVLFELKDCKIVSRLIEGEFIKYENFFKKEFSTLVTCKREHIINSLERSMLISKGPAKINSIKLKIGDEKIEVTSKTETGLFKEEIAVEVDGTDMEIGFNPRYLVDALKVLEHENVLMQFTSPLTPCIIKGQDDEDGVYLVTPLRLLN
jgi:DNA polymerase-3 subunit beta